MIYFNNALSQAIDWNNPEYAFSHVDYPKCIAILSAQMASMVGYWNDILPKMSILVLLVPAVLGSFCFFKRINISFVYLYLMLFFSLDSYLFNGYMDAYLAIYACLSLLLFLRWSKTNNPSDFISGVAFISVMTLLKNEGLLYLFVFISSFVLFLFFNKTNRYYFYTTLKIDIFWYMTAIFASNIIVWEFLKQRWALKNDLKLGTDSIEIITARLKDGSLTVIAKAMLLESNAGISILILLLSIFFSLKLRTFYFKDIMLCVVVAFIYSTGMYLVYLSTPHELLWHLKTSVDRTMMVVNLSLIAATFVLITNMENQNDSSH
jgi:hypothetical protein